MQPVLTITNADWDQPKEKSSASGTYPHTASLPRTIIFYLDIKEVLVSTTPPFPTSTVHLFMNLIPVHCRTTSQNFLKISNRKKIVYNSDLAAQYISAFGVDGKYSSTMSDVECNFPRYCNSKNVTSPSPYESAQ